MNDTEKYYLAFRAEVSGREEDKKAVEKEVRNLREANLKLTAEQLDLKERLLVAEELAHGVLTKSVDKYLNCG